MTLDDFCKSLTEEKRFGLALRLVNQGVAVWENYALKGKLKYRDSVVWMKHEVNKNILQNALKTAESYSAGIGANKDRAKKEAVKILAEFEEPVTALQDDDWKLPPPVEKIFYSVYNLLNAVTAETETEKFLCIAVNQAIDAIDCAKLLSGDEIKEILSSFRE